MSQVVGIVIDGVWPSKRNLGPAHSLQKPDTNLN